ncbi:uncharacterized protein LOC127280839 isoform X2 [Leptopilina boulardi]|nr:uncharacterized protein LOC127280839 isoform X2 [Leptopilina boulardi]
MYGAKEDEYVDITFVNVMFDYIISSIVFAKYGNVYGFLGTIFCKAENLQFEEVLNIIRLHLQKASFDNEYGNSSTLSDLSVARIYNDIILPLFPVTKNNLSLLSLDYIYAQAGSMFLRAARINSNNYINFENNSLYLTEDNLFEQYLLIGHLIEKFFQTDKKNYEILKAFALPALMYHIFNLKYFFAYENIVNIISDSVFWQEAYKSLFQYTTKSFNDINTVLNNNNFNTLTINSAVCSLYKIEIFERFLKEGNILHFLSTLGTTIQSVCLINLISKTVDEIVTEQSKSDFSIKSSLNRNEIFENLCSHINDPGFYLTFITKDKISVIEEIINSLKEKIDFSFTSVINSLSKISILKSNFHKSIGYVGENNSRFIFINTLNNQSDTGYGYKFIFLSDHMFDTAQLRSGHEFKQKIFVLQIRNSENKTKIYIALNYKTFRTDYLTYEINNKLWKKNTRDLFYGISVQADDYDEKCNDIRYFENTENVNRCRRRRRLGNKALYEEKAVSYIEENTNFTLNQVRHMLEKYTFPDLDTLALFINDLIESKSLREPIWSRKYIIENPDLLKKLRYATHFEEHTTMSEYDGEFRINSLYTRTLRRLIEGEVTIKNIIQKYNEQKACFSVSFHDYYAIRNYATTGYQRITRDTNEAKLMKIALYKLAIRQSEDPDEEFDLTLFRVESKPTRMEKIIFTEDYITFKKFTQASPNMEYAMKFAGYPTAGYINIVYEMIFSGPYLRTKIEKFYEKVENSVILLPGSKFLIEHCKYEDIEGLGVVLKLKLVFNNTANDKYVWYYNIMNEITQISF